MSERSFEKSHFQVIRETRGNEGNSADPKYRIWIDGYAVTERWAEGVRARLFPSGERKCIKRPLIQGGRYARYMWARIFDRPQGEVEDRFAYTVTIDPDHGFITKVDTTTSKALPPQASKAFEALRGPICAGGNFVDVLGEDEGLRMSLDELVEWSVRAIQNMPLSLETFADRVGVSLSRDPLAAPVLTDDEEMLLKHFDQRAQFREARSNWSEETRATFLLIARSVHAAGFDWWLINQDNEVRFGRKERGAEAGNSVIGVVTLRSTSSRTPLALKTRKPVGALAMNSTLDVTGDLVDRFAVGIAAPGLARNVTAPKQTGRAGYWPHELTVSPKDESMEDISIVKSVETRGPRNIIFYGPPGTGKTKRIQDLMEEYVDWPTEGIGAPSSNEVLIQERLPMLRWWEKLAYALFDLGGRAKVAQISRHPLIELVIRGHKSKNARVWATLQSRTTIESKTVRYALRHKPAIFDKTENSEWTLIDGWQNATPALQEIFALRTSSPKDDDGDDVAGEGDAAGISRTAESPRFCFVTFHQSYGYEDFIEGLRPVLRDEEEQDLDAEQSSERPLSRDVKYEIKPGAFVALCEDARLRPNDRFAIFIDEINRGNVSKIFGELITLIECDKRERLQDANTLGSSKSPLRPVRLAVSGNPFLVPDNVDIYGTMNTVDRSLASIDIALRRRFEFEACYPETGPNDLPLVGLTARLEGKEVDIRRMLEIMNQRIEILLDRDHTLGHAYFIELKDVDDHPRRFERLSQIFKNKILPLLEEYFFEDWSQIRLILGDNQKQDEELQFIQVRELTDAKLRALFGDVDDVRDIAEKPRYIRNPEALGRVDAYVGIYSK